MSEAILLALTGASGMPYGLRLLECLLEAGREVWLVASKVAPVVAKQEMGISLSARASDLQRELGERYGARPDQLRVFGREDWLAPPASGSNPPRAMVICPCSMAVVARVAAGLADSLIERAADVVLKEGRKLVIVPRETPFSSIHLRNMLRLAEAGAIILPANPGFYHHPQSAGDLVDFVVARILDQLSVPHALMARWGDRRRPDAGEAD